MIVGIGNVGSEYEATRHNVGFMVVDLLAANARKTFKPGKGEYYFAEMRHAGEDVVLIKPTTFMNNSGVAVKDASQRYGVGMADLLVVYDDFNIPLGKLRLRKGGSDGGHNGMYSIIYHLNDDSFPRLRCGIGTGDVMPRRDMAGFVLSEFGDDELPETERMIKNAADAVFVFVGSGIQTAMNKFN